MIGAVSSTESMLERIPRADRHPVELDLPVTPPPQHAPIISQAMELLESHEAAAAAIGQAQVAIFKEGLDLSREMAQQMLNMIQSADVLTRSAQLAEQPLKQLDIVA